MIRKLILIFALAATAFSAFSIDPGRAFVSAPESRFPLIPQMKRMDMLDYFRAGVSKPSQNILGGESAILAETDNSITIRQAGVQDVITTISIAPGASKDSVMILTTEYLTPAPDGMVSVYNSRWEKYPETVFAEPVTRDWILRRPELSAEDIENILPFVTAKYSFNPDTGILTLTNTVSEYLDETEYSKIKSSLLPEIRYRWDGKKFRRQ